MWNNEQRLLFVSECLVLWSIDKVKRIAGNLTKVLRLKLQAGYLSRKHII